MGGSSYSDDAARHLYGAVRSTKTTDEVFTSTTASAVHAAGMDPKTIKVREARDSAAHPNSNAVEILFDVTGSMGGIPKKLAMDPDKLPALMRLLITNGYIEDPQVMFGAIGDAYSDSAPLQVGQFESGLEMDDWLTKLYVEGGGGGGGHESYEMALWWSANHVSMDCLEKRGKKGYLFLMGDEMAYGTLPKAIAKKWLDDDVQSDLTIREILAAAQEKFEVFFIYVEGGSYPGSKQHHGFWRELLGERFLVMKDINHVAELIGSTIGLCEGRGLDDVAADLTKAGMSPAAVAGAKDALVPYSRSARGMAKTGVASGELAAMSASSGSTRL
jgi:hypothetical protein